MYIKICLGVMMSNIKLEVINQNYDGYKFFCMPRSF